MMSSPGICKIVQEILYSYFMGITLNAIEGCSTVDSSSISRFLGEV